MWKNTLQLPTLSLVRNYAKQYKKRMKEKVSVMAHGQLKQFPTYKYNRSKPTDRRVYVWGMAQTGALGVNQTLHDQKLAKIINCPTRQSFAERFNVIDVSAGYGFTLFACKPELDEMTLFGCGLNTDSQLGYQRLGGETNRPMELMIYPAPIALPKIQDDENMNIKRVAAGRAHSIALSEAGILYLLGNNSFGQCARSIVEDEEYFANRTINRIDTKSLIGTNDTVKEIVCGLDHSLFLTNEGKVFSCGWGADGQTGLGHFNSACEFGEVEGDIKNEKIVKVASKYDCVLALNDKGEVFGWGNSEYGQLDLTGGVQQINVPIQIHMLKKFGKIIDIAISGSGCMVLNENGDVFIWGFGLLGLGPSVEQAIEPKQIPPILFGRNDFNPDSRVTAIYAGFSHYGAVSSTHDLYMWGRNRSCCLGVTHEKDQYFPLKVAINAMVDKVDCGVDHSIAYCKPFM